MLTITANANKSTITIFNGVDYIDAPIGEISVFSQGQYVSVYWSPTQYVSDLYSNFTVVSSTYGSADAVENAIAALLVLSSGGGGGTIGGTVPAPDVAFGTGTGGTTLAGDASFQFNASGTDKEVSANVLLINNNGNPSPIGKNNYLENVGGQLYWTTGGQSYKIQMSL